MPATIKPADLTGLRDQLPASLLALLDQVAMNPMTSIIPAAGAYAEPILASLGKPLQELLGLVLSPTKGGSGLPRRLRLTQWNARTGNVEFHGQGPRPIGVERFEATPAQLDKLIRGGALDLEQPTESAMAPIRRKLSAALDKGKK